MPTLKSNKIRKGLRVTNWMRSRKAKINKDGLTLIKFRIACSFSYQQELVEVKNRIKSEEKVRMGQIDAFCAKYKSQFTKNITLLEAGKTLPQTKSHRRNNKIKKTLEDYLSQNLMKKGGRDIA